MQTLMRVLSQSSIFGQNLKIGYQEFKDLQTLKRSKTLEKATLRQNHRINTSFIVAQYSLFGIQVCACGCNLSRSRTSSLCCSDNMGISRTCMTTALAWYIIIVFARERYATVQMEITK